MVEVRNIESILSLKEALKTFEHHFLHSVCLSLLRIKSQFQQPFWTCCFFALCLEMKPNDKRHFCFNVKFTNSEVAGIVILHFSLDITLCIYVGAEYCDTLTISLGCCKSHSISKVHDFNNHFDRNLMFIDWWRTLKSWERLLCNRDQNILHFTTV